MDKEKIVFLLLRVGLAFVFIYAAISATINPINWIGYFPQFLRSVIPDNLLLPPFSLAEVILGLWMLWGKKLFFPSLIATFATAGIIFFNLNQMDIVFRDVSIMLTGAALAVHSYDKDFLKF